MSGEILHVGFIVLAELKLTEPRKARRSSEVGNKTLVIVSCIDAEMLDCTLPNLEKVGIWCRGCHEHLERWGLGKNLGKDAILVVVSSYDRPVVVSRVCLLNTKSAQLWEQRATFRHRG